jgi:hypothetical protein
VHRVRVRRPSLSPRAAGMTYAWRMMTYACGMESRVPCSTFTVCAFAARQPLAT